ncbi:MAG: CNP1-like family protein, partial [Rhodoferax sp.]|nr:CNP1-like family protein [Rhodoferax sp.]
MRKLFTLCFLTFAAGQVLAQVAALDPDWQESEAAAPPAFSAAHLVAIDMPHYVSLKFGVDPATLSITPDGIVRYVMVAQNATGSVNAMYEGIRCATGQVKTYAR